MGAQYLVHTVVPQKEVASGGAFQVQYVVQQSDKFLSLKAPLFSPNFQLISGPRIYRGFAMVNKVKVPIQNFTYTLMPLAEGRLLLKGATAIYKNAIIK
ncbi:MAG: BatD family protein, partial [Chitinophagaceae bacterium]